MQVSHSRVETFKKCPYQFKLRYVDKLETYPNTDANNPLIIGTALHTGIENDTETAIKEYYANYPVITDKHVDEAIKLEAVIKKCKESLPPLDNAIFEHELDCPEFKGFIDLLVPVTVPKEERYVADLYDPKTKETSNEVVVAEVNGDYEWFDMYDFKYSNNVKNYAESGQLHEYKYYFEKLNPTKRIRDMYFLFAPKVQIRQKYKNKTNKRDETIGEFRKRIDAELQDKDARMFKVMYDITKVKDFLKNAKACKEASTFPKQPTRLCDWCEYQSYCEKGETLDIMNLPSNERRTVAANDHKKIWLYGAPFSGKTYFANQFPDPLMLNTDGNIKYVDAPFIAIKDEVSTEGRITKRKYAWEVFQEAVAELEKGDNDFKTIVVDLLEDIYDSCRVKVCADKGWEHESDDSFKAYDIVRSEFLRTLKRLLNLDYNIVLISHEDTSRDITKKSNDKVTAIKPNIAEKVANKVAGMVDIVARIINDDGVHKVSFKTNEVVFGGGRLTISEKEIDSDYDELCKVYDEANAGKKTVPAKKETKKEEVAATKEASTLEKDTYFKTADGNYVMKHAGDVAPEDAEVITKAAFNKGVKEIAQNDNVEPADEEPKRRSRKTRTEEPAEVETADAPPVEAETTEEAPKRRRRRRVDG